MPVITVRTTEDGLAARDALRSPQVHTLTMHKWSVPIPNDLPWDLRWAEPSEPRPSPNHRLVVVLHAKVKRIASHWAEVHDGKVFLDIPELNEFDAYMAGKVASELRTRNRSVDYSFGDGAQAPHSEVAPRHFSHGIAGCSYSLLSSPSSLLSLFSPLPPLSPSAELCANTCCRQVSHRTGTNGTSTLRSSG